MIMAFLSGTLRRELQLRLVFRWGLLLEALSMASMLVVFYLVDRFQGQLLGDKVTQALSGLNTSYFGYVALGLAISTLANTGLGGLLEGLHEEKSSRTLELIMASPVSIELWALGAGVSNLVRALSQFAVIFIIAIVALGLEVPRFNASAALAVLITATVPLWCLALVTLCGAMVFRRGNPISFVLSLAFEILGGVYVPQTVLPEPLRVAGEFLPITPAVRAMQAVVYSGAGLSNVAADVAQLLFLSALYLPIALLLLRKSDQVCRRRGYYSLA